MSRRLNAFCIVFGVLNVAAAMVPFLFRIERIERGLEKEKVVPPWVKGLSSFIGIATLSCTIWGAVEVFPNTSYFGGPASLAEAQSRNVTDPENGYCAPNIIYTSFIATILPWIICTGMLVYFLAKKK